LKKVKNYRGISSNSKKLQTEITKILSFQAQIKPFGQIPPQASSQKKMNTAITLLSYYGDPAAMPHFAQKGILTHPHPHKRRKSSANSSHGIVGTETQVKADENNNFQ
jgi:hypothetical protein